MHTFKLLLITTLCAVSLAAAEDATLLDFGSGSPAAGKAKASGPAAASITIDEEADSLVIRTPNFWSTQVQVDDVGMDLSFSKPTNSLAIEMKGTISGKNPTLRLVLFAPGWSKKSEWLFDLTEVNPDEYTLVKSTTPVSQPVSEAENEGAALDVNGLVGVLQILTTGEDTDQPWVLDIKSIKMVE